ncbi:MAG: carbon-nitrogen hydrolase family protein [Sumerlaeia bacterium]
MKPFAIAGIQMYLSASQSNVAAMKSRIDILMSLYPWVQMVVFSELAPLGPFLRSAQPFPADKANEVEAEFAEIAQKYGIWLLPGSIFELVGETYYNTASVINPEGKIVGRYRKMFPFFPYEVGVTGGTEFLVFDVPTVGRFGVSICYDMWFGETTRTLAAMGAEVILHPTMTNTIDREVELSIARASAACNQCFFFDINGCGELGNGQSIIVGPAGDILHQAGHSEQMIPLEIDLDRVRRSREVGLRGLGQPLKSFRDRTAQFEIYSKADAAGNYLQTLGELQKAARGSRAGLRPHEPLGTDYNLPETNTPLQASIPIQGAAPKGVF